MLEKKIKMKSDNLLILLSYLKAETLMSNISFNYDDLYIECVKDNNEINIEKWIDQIMLDLYKPYIHLKNIPADTLFGKMNQTISLFGISDISDNIIDESMTSLNDFIGIYEKILMETKFELFEIRNIQKTIFNALLLTYTNNENYEKCIEFKEKIKEI
jgi:hypothetical protein